MIGYFLGINLFTLFLFAFDKNCSRKGRYRVSEKIFFLLAFLGGVPALLLGIPLFSHKTKKRSFQIPILLIVLFYVLALLFF